MIAFASSLDQAGTITRTAEDAARLLAVMAGFDERDSTSIDEPVPDYVAELGASVKGLKIGVVRQHFDEGLDADCGARVRDAIDVLESLGATTVEVDLPNLDLSVPTYYVVAPAECSSNLSRFDGVRFGHRAADAEDLAQEVFIKVFTLLDRYDDGGYSGATMDRPALTRLLTDIERGRVDCLVCHDNSGVYLKQPGGAGAPDASVDLLQVARSVGMPLRQNCGSCHFQGGGGNAIKHGDMDETLLFPSARIDIHMGRQNMQCIDCHRTEQHRIRGRSMSVSIDPSCGSSERSLRNNPTIPHIPRSFCVDGFKTMALDSIAFLCGQQGE